MHKMTAAQWLLSCVAGKDRAAVVMGDLLEISASRGRIWFWAAYLRTVVTLAWRPLAAFLGCFAFFNYMLSGGLHDLLKAVEPRHQPPKPDLGMFLEVFRISAVGLVIGLLSVLPYAILRFGWRDRISQLAGLLLLLAMPWFTFRFWIASVTIAMAVIVYALCSRRWRYSVIVVLAASGAAQVAPWLSYLIMIRFFPPVYPIDHHAGLHHTRWLINKLGIVLGVLTVAALCSLLTRWLRPTLQQTERTIV